MFYDFAGLMFRERCKCDNIAVFARWRHLIAKTHYVRLSAFYGGLMVVKVELTVDGYNLLLIHCAFRAVNRPSGRHSNERLLTCVHGCHGNGSLRYSAAVAE